MARGSCHMANRGPWGSMIAMRGGGCQDISLGLFLKTMASSSSRPELSLGPALIIDPNGTGSLVDAEIVELYDVQIVEPESLSPVAGLQKFVEPEKLAKVRTRPRHTWRLSRPS